MTFTNGTPVKQWTVKQAAILAVLCLIVGIAGGWAIRGPQDSGVTGIGKARAVTPVNGDASNPAPNLSNPVRLKNMADAQAAPVLDKLRSDPSNPALLASVGNIYYDAQQYPIAVDYYGRALKVRPSDAAIRTDMGTAFWYIGNADSAIAEFKKALIYSPNNPNTLYNLGLVESQGKKNNVDAVADWEKLLSANPNYEGKDRVNQMIAEAKKQGKLKP
jgi:cytochrome c-type biogenesis protein CcmH/NrfG